MLSENSKADHIKEKTAEAIMAVVFFGAFGLMAASALELDAVWVPIKAVMAVGILAIAAGTKNTPQMLLITSAACAIIGLIFKDSVRGGITACLNQGALRLMEVSGRIHTGFQTEAKGEPSILFPLMASAVMALLCLWAASGGAGNIAFALIEMAVLAGVISGIVPIDGCLIGFFAATVLMAAFKAIHRSSNSGRYAAALQALPICIAAIVLIGIACVQTGAADAADPARAVSAIENSIHERKYEKAENPLPEGRLKEVGPFEPGNTIALQVSLSSKETTYLRGFTGERYSDNTWLTGPGSAAVKDGPLFYWLHRNRFYGQSQLSRAYSMTGQQPEGFISVTAVVACRKYIYIPYGFKQENSIIADPQVIGDADIECGNIEASEDYLLKYRPGAVRESYMLQKKLKKASKSSVREIREYLNNETAYRRSVYRNYRDVPADIETVLRKSLGRKEKKTTTEAKAAILSYMNNNIKYSEEAAASQAVSGKEDFVVKFLQTDKKGYCVHYASAAVMMMRYFGIPARYVEGFIVPDRLQEETAENSSLPLTMRYSHAWAEYYLDGVGWVPFETVPKYQNSEMYDGAGNGRNGGAEGDSSAGENQSKDGKHGGSKGKGRNQEHKRKNDSPLVTAGKAFILNLPLMAAGLLLIIAALLILTAVRRHRLKQYLNTFTGEDAKTAAANAFAYSIALMRRAGVEIDMTVPAASAENAAKWMESSEAGEAYRRCAEISGQLKYGIAQVTEEQRQQVLDFEKQVAARYRNVRSIRQKFKDRIVKCIY